MLWQLTGDAVTDVPLYRTYGERIANGLVPYRDFGFEYPPGALPALVLPALLTDSLTAYRIVFGAEMALAGAIGVLLVAHGLRRLGRRDEDRRVALTAIALLPLLLGGVILTRFDLLPAALVAGALALLLAGRHEAGAVVLGIGVAVKLYPAVLVPLAAVAAYRRGGRRALAATVGLAAAPVVLLYLPFLVVGLDGVLDSFGRQLGRPLQIESLGAGILLGAAPPLRASRSSGRRGRARRTSPAGPQTPSPSSRDSRRLSPSRSSGSRSHGARRRRERLVRYAAAAVVAFVALSKVLSPQFLVWLLLLVPLVGGRAGSRRALADGARLRADCRLVSRALLGARQASSTRWRHGSCSRAVLTLVALLAMLMLPATERARARSRSPAPSPGRT